MNDPVPHFRGVIRPLCSCKAHFEQNSIEGIEETSDKCKERSEEKLGQKGQRSERVVAPYPCREDDKTFYNHNTPQVLANRNKKDIILEEPQIPGGGIAEMFEPGASGAGGHLLRGT